jgi:3-hydroxyisobutyrate dehydrogenase-like beta-hydroxyacid dehydrogenase
MVLVRNRLAACAAWLLLMGLAACLKSQPVQRLSSPQTISVAIVHDLGSDLSAVPDALASEISASLSARNLVMNQVAPEQYQADFSLKRATKDRLKTLQGLAKETPLQLLVETRAEYYSQLEGRYRWGHGSTHDQQL